MGERLLWQPRCYPGPRWGQAATRKGDSSRDVAGWPGTVLPHDLVLREFHKGFILFCEFCVEDLLVLLAYLLLVVLEEPLTQVAHLPQRERRLVLLHTRRTWRGAGSHECRVEVGVVAGAGVGEGAVGLSGAACFALVEGPLQLSPPLVAAVLLTDVMEDLLRGEPLFSNHRLR